MRHAVRFRQKGCPTDSVVFDDQHEFEHHLVRLDVDEPHAADLAALLRLD